MCSQILCMKPIGEQNLLKLSSLKVGDYSVHNAILKFSYNSQEKLLLFSMHYSCMLGVKGWHQVKLLITNQKVCIITMRREWEDLPEQYQSNDPDYPQHYHPMYHRGTSLHRAYNLLATKKSIAAKSFSENAWKRLREMISASDFDAQNHTALENILTGRYQRSDSANNKVHFSFSFVVGLVRLK